MPPRWPRKPDRNDPEYRRLGDRINFALHVGIFAATNSGLWFVRELESASWPWTLWITLGWLGALTLHGVYVFAIANYTTTSASAESISSKGFGQSGGNSTATGKSPTPSTKTPSRNK